MTASPSGMSPMEIKTVNIGLYSAKVTNFVTIFAQPMGQVVNLIRHTSLH